MQLGKPETLGMLDDHHRRVRHVDADLDHRRRHQEARLAVGKGGHRPVLVGRFHASVDQRDAAGKVRRQRLVPLLDGGEIGGLRLLDHRADPIDLGASRQGPADRRHDIVEALECHGPGIDRVSSRRLLGEPRDIEVAIGGHHQSTRDRGGAHQQRIGVLSLGVEAETLLDAKTVLLVDHDECKIAKLDIRLQQGVRTDDHRGQTRGEARQHRGARPAFFAAGQKADLDMGRGGMALQGRVMLAGEDFRWRHQGRLAAAFDRGQHRQQSDDGLAAADIALQQPHHASRLRHLRGDLGNCQALRRCQPEAECRLDPAGQRAVAEDRPPLLPVSARADQRHRELAGKDLVIGEPLARRRRRQQIGFVRRGLRLADCFGPMRPAATLAQCRIDPFRQCRRPLESRLDCLLHDARRETGGHWVDRLDRLEAVEFVRPQHEIGVSDLRHAAVELDEAADDTFGADRQQPRQLVAPDVEVDQGQGAGIIGAKHPIRTTAMPRLVPQG